jgi:hypothetical protein
VTRWKLARVAEGGTHHVVGDEPLYPARFLEVLSFHEPGLAPARGASGAYHIDATGKPAYAARYLRTFGFYEGLAAVIASDGWCHVRPDGSPAYAARHAWCGNYQGGRCAARGADGRSLHLDERGEPVYPERWRYAGDYREGTAVVQREDGLHTHVDRAGRPVHGRWFLDHDALHKGLARARDEAGWTHVDRAGRPAYARRFAMVEPFYNGQARVEREDGGLEVIDEHGGTVLEIRQARRDPFDALSGDMVGFWRTETLATAAELGVIDLLPASSSEIAGRLALPEPSAQRLLAALGELAVITREGDTWIATDKGRHMRRDHPLSLRDAAVYWAREHRDAWRALGDALRARPHHGWFEALAADRDRVAAYHRVLRAYAAHDYAALAGSLDADHRVVLDAGGGTGVLVEILLAARPAWRAVLFDRPEVIEEARVSPALRHRIELRGGDLFDAWPARADAILLARVLHDWPDEDAVRILVRARGALEARGRIYAVELLRGEEGFDGALLDLHMLAVTGGRERTRQEFEVLLNRAGLRLLEVRGLPSVSSVIVAEAR